MSNHRFEGDGDCDSYSFQHTCFGPLLGAHVFMFVAVVGVTVGLPLLPQVVVVLISGATTF